MDIQLTIVNIGGKEFKFIENEDGTADVQVPEKIKLSAALKEINKHFEDDNNTEYEAVPVTEKKVIPAADEFSESIGIEIITGIKIQPKAPKEEQIETLATSQENKSSEKDSESKQIANNGKPIDRQYAHDLIEAAGITKNKKYLQGLDVSGDKELSALVEKYFPQPKQNKMVAQQESLRMVELIQPIIENRMEEKGISYMEASREVMGEIEEHMQKKAQKKSQ